MSISPSSATRQTALSVRRSELRTSLIASPSASLKIAIRLASLARGSGFFSGRSTVRRFDPVLLVGADRRAPELVDRIRHQQHFDAARAEAFELRTAFDDI